MSNRIRILKADDVAGHAVVTLPRPGEPSERSPAPEILAAPEIEVLVEQARAEGANDAASVLEPSLRQLASAMTELVEESAAARFAALRADSETVIDTALTVCRWILDRELSEPDAVVDLAERALADTGDAMATRIRVHPELAQCLAEIAPDDLSVIADGSLAHGEFVTETTGPEIAFRYDEALARAREALRDGGAAK